MISKRRSIARFPLPRMMAGLMVAALVPLSLMPVFGDFRTGLPGEFEHVGAYMVSATILSMMMPGRLIASCVGFSLLALALEALQSFVPGRTADLKDALAGSIGAICGIALVHCASHWRKRRAELAPSKGHMP